MKYKDSRNTVALLAILSTLVTLWGTAQLATTFNENTVDLYDNAVVMALVISLGLWLIWGCLWLVDNPKKPKRAPKNNEIIMLPNGISLQSPKSKRKSKTKN